MVNLCQKCQERQNNYKILLHIQRREVEFEGSGRTSDRIKISLSKDASVELYLVLSTS